MSGYLINKYKIFMNLQLEIDAATPAYAEDKAYELVKSHPEYVNSKISITRLVKK